MAAKTQSLFIIGSPKSGTTWLQIMIAAHPQVCTTVELTLFSRYTAPWVRAWNNEAANIEEGRWHQGLPFLWEEDEFYAFLREFVDRVYERVLANNPGATRILDKHPAYARHVHDINRIIPDARFIHVIRDGRDVAASMVAARRQIGYGTGTIQSSAAAWKEHVVAAREAPDYGGRYLELKYEDLLGAGVETLKRVFDFCDLAVGRDRLTEIVEGHPFDSMKARRQYSVETVKAHEAFYRKGKAGGWREDLEPVERHMFHKVAGDLLIQLGYAQEG
jgi:hypothetical protein